MVNTNGIGGTNCPATQYVNIGNSQNHEFDVAGDVTYTYTYAEVGKYTVTFDSQGGSSVDMQTVPEGGKATEPDKPTRENAVFAGWVKEGENEFYDFDTVMTGNIKLVAQWDEDNLVAPTVPEGERPTTGGDGSINIPDDDVPQNLDPGIDIPDPDVPLAPAPSLNSTDHFAYIIGYADVTVRPAGNSFSDVADASLWYNNAVSNAAKAGLLKGREAGKFHPSDNITRAELATIAARFLSNDEVTAQPFPDAVGHWAEQDIIRAVQAGWIKGNSDGTFRPDDPITRARL